ncbi:MAG: cystathionine beta-synthase [Chloroflexia bacterium]|jgi:cystathionine beta-synthase|nr:cystathionine beta-synthase [Chloroflexia bacterium]
MEVYNDILETIGNTPMVRLNKVGRGLKPTMLAKLEMFNPGNSVKDRIGIRMIRAAEEKGLLRKGGTIVEPTSGNTGTGLAIAAAILGYKCVFVMPDKVSHEKIALLKAYGADVVTTPTAVPRESPESYYSVSDRLTREIPGAFQPNQYFNPANPRTHYETTGPEIWRQTDGRIDAFVAGVGTGGTISGIGKFLKEQDSRVRIVGADPEGSIYTQDRARPYKVEGIGEDFIPGTYDGDVIDEWVTVSDRDSFEAARRVTREEGILIGGSGGTAMHAAIQTARTMSEGQVIVVLLPDTGRGYLSKLYNDAWMRENGFLDRLATKARVRDLVIRGNRELPKLVTVPSHKTVREAIDLLQQYSISQLPVTRTDSGDGNGRGPFTDVHEMVGSIQERNLLERVFRDPSLIDAKVETVMDSPFPLVDVAEEVERVVPALLANNSAVLVEEAGQPVGLITRSDLLEFVAHGQMG